MAQQNSQQNSQVYNLLALLAGMVKVGQNNSLVQDGKENGTAVRKALKEPVNWEEILRMADQHNLYALVVELSSDYEEFKKSSAYHSCMTRAMQQVAEQVQRTEAFLELYRAFSKSGLCPIVMKGIICRQLYGEYRDHRPSGDEDILIQKKDFELAKKILESQGYAAERENITSEQLDELQEVSFTNTQTGLYIELHINPTGHENRLRRRMNECFTNVFSDDQEVEIEGVRIRTMNHRDHFLFLILHAIRHFTDGGIGIRQVLDILLYQRKYSDAIDWDYINRKLKEFDAFLFLSDLIHIGNQYLGFQLPAFGEPNCPDDLLEEMMYSGAFGNATQAQRTAKHMTAAVMTSRAAGRNKGKIMVMLQTFFPGKDLMINRHPELQEKPWLLPLRWLQRCGRFLRHNRSNGGNLARESMEISRRRIRILEKYKII